MIAVECDSDVDLVRFLGVSKKGILHAGCISKVVKHLSEGRADTGLVDEDPKGTHSSEFRNYKPIEQRGGFKLLRHRNKSGKRLIVICPRFEEWLLGRAKAVGLDPSGFGLPADAHALHNSGRYERKPGYRRFLEELLSLDVEFQRLKGMVVPTGNSGNFLSRWL